MRLTLVIEGGSSTALNRSARQAFRSLLENARLDARRLHIVMGGARTETLKDFLRLRDSQTPVFLLIDSEGHGPGRTVTKWQFIRDDHQLSSVAAGHSVDSESIFFMVRCMEAWIAADPEALSIHHGRGFRMNRTPPLANLELISATELKRKLENATEDCSVRFGKASAYGALARVRPDPLQNNCPAAKEWLDAIREWLNQH